LGHHVYITAKDNACSFDFPDGPKADPPAFCENEVFNATCDPGHVIVMTKANYGRMHLCRCVVLNYGHIGCGADVLELADTRCSGKRQCEIRVPDPLLGKTKPCPDDLKPYLEADYRCIKGMCTN
jgi:hypothetical protein